MQLAVVKPGRGCKTRCVGGVVVVARTGALGFIIGFTVIAPGSTQAETGSPLTTAVAGAVAATSHISRHPDSFATDYGEHYYVQIGSAKGAPLVVINGGPGLDHRSVASSHAWDLLAATRPVVLYDQRGTGKSISRTPAAEITVNELVNDLEALRSHLGAAQLEVVGWSWGGFLALAYAAAHENRVAHLVLVGSAPPKLADNIYLFETVFPDIAARQVPNKTVAGQVGCESERIDDYMLMEFYDPDKRDRFMAQNRPFAFSEQTCIAAMLDALRIDLNPQVSKLAVPTLVTSGRFDMNVAPIVSYRLSKLIPNARLQIFERSGHMPFHEQPDEFARVVEEFLAQGVDR